MSSRRSSIAVAALAALLCLAALSAPASAEKIRFLRDTTRNFDSFTCGSCASDGEKQWMRSHYWRVRAFSPWFDSSFGSASAINWSPPALAYTDLYAIYRDDRSGGEPDTALIDSHPHWVLRDGPDDPATGAVEGNPLYIPWNCADSAPGCPEFAADIGSPGFRQWWINRARDLVGRGYRGLFIDDVNMDFRVSDGSEHAVLPWDPRTGHQMTLEAWRRYIANFTAAIRRALPNAEIVHNEFFWPPDDDRYVQRQNRAATFLELERGFDDPGLTGQPAAKQFSYRRLLRHIAFLHRLGRSVVEEPEMGRTMANGQPPTVAVESARRENSIAAYYVIRARRDAITSDFQSDPPRSGAANNWSPVWETDLGSPLGGRYMWKGVMRRNFSGGFVLVNLPQQPQRTLALGGSFRRLDGGLVSTVTLRRTPPFWQGPALTPAEESVSQGAVLLKP